MKSIFSEVKRVHCIGIKGQGMTALVEMLLSRGFSITGSDTEEEFTTDKVLRSHGIDVMSFSPENITEDIDLVIHSTAYNDANNSELKSAREKGKRVLSYPEAIGELTKERLTLAVCGTHGKTTTSALLAETLKSIGLDPAAIIGSTIPKWNGNALTGKGDYLVLEADEYQDKLALYHPFAVILTSADWDHPDFFPDKESYKDAFRRFVARIPKHGVLVYCNDSADVVDIVSSASCEKISYGSIPGADIRIFERKGEGLASGVMQRIIVEKKGEMFGVFDLALPGAHNALNATAVIALLNFLRIEKEKYREAIGAFSGAERRFEYIGERFGALVYDDFAHHPEEVRAALKAFRELYPKKTIRVVFHPHTFTRTKALFEEFAQCFEDADHVYLLDIYGSAREVHGGVSSDDLAKAINRYTNDKAERVESIPVISEKLVSLMGRNDVIITMGAGDVWQVGRAILKG